MPARPCNRAIRETLPLKICKRRPRQLTFRDETTVGTGYVVVTSRRASASRVVAANRPSARLESEQTRISLYSYTRRHASHERQRDGEKFPSDKRRRGLKSALSVSRVSRILSATFPRETRRPPTARVPKAKIYTRSLSLSFSRSVFFSVFGSKAIPASTSLPYNAAWWRKQRSLGTRMGGRYPQNCFER